MFGINQEGRSVSSMCTTMIDSIKTLLVSLFLIECGISAVITLSSSAFFWCSSFFIDCRTSTSEYLMDISYYFTHKQNNFTLFCFSFVSKGYL